MSNAARKHRKRMRKVWGYPHTEIVRTETRVEFYGHGMGRYQHPTREGIPYGRSKQPNLNAMLPTVAQVERTALMIAAAREGGGWR